MPALAAFARTGVTFERAYAAGAATRVSLGLIHQRSGPDTLDLVDRLERAGVRATAVIPDHRGIVQVARGFDSIVTAANDAEAVTDAALATLAAGDGAPGPRYLWVHYFDPHHPYRARAGVALPADVSSLPPDRDYLSEIAYTDAAMARLFAAIPRDRAVVVVTGDHGQGLGAHGVPLHGHSGFEEVVRVTAVAAAPGLAAARYPHLVSHRDIPQTILGAFGLAPDERTGRSWLRLIDAPDAPMHEFVVTRSARYSSGTRGYVPLGVLVAGHHKLIASYGDRAFALYDLAADPHERTNLAASDPDTLDRLWRALALFTDVEANLDANPTSYSPTSH
jgi:arylsulfatase A-like enzyme